MSEPDPKPRVIFIWSDDGLTLEMHDSVDLSRSMVLKWHDKSEIPEEEKLVQIFHRHFDNDVDNENGNKRSFTRMVSLPFGFQAFFGFINGAEYDTALIRLGFIDVSCPIDENGKVVLSPSAEFSDTFGFGAGNASSAIWLSVSKL